MANQQARLLRRSMTRQEAMLWQQLRLLRHEGYHFRRQAPVGRHILDFACLRHHLVIEVDGSGHAHHRQMLRDRERDSVLTDAGFRVLRVWNTEVEQNLEGVMARIRDALGARRTPPTALRAVPPPRSGEG